MSILGEEFDSFWDLSSMIHKKQQAKKETKSPSTPSTAIPILAEVDDEGAEQTSEEKQINFNHGIKGKLIVEYAPKDTPFISNVKLYQTASQFSFYSSFREDALRYFNFSGKVTSAVAYFSYIPQYSQMSKAQLDFYFYFRAQAREGNFIPCDVTYFWLYIYEIINLPDKISPEIGVKQMCQAWAAFRDKHPKIDKYMTVWLADYCLVNQIPCPTEYIVKFLPIILEHAGFKEFYLGHIKEHNIYGVHTLLSLVSTYPWQKSKFVLSLKENERKYLLLALIEVLKDIYQDSSLLQTSERISIMERDAYSGSLCGHNIKCRIVASYRALNPTGRLSDVLTCAVKYVENKMRIMHGQKSRLTVGESLLERHKLIIDAYFDQFTPKSQPKTSKKVVRADYEKQYDAEEVGISMAAALSIEDNSWENTRKLIEDTDVAFETNMQVTDEAKQVTAVPPIAQNGVSGNAIANTLLTLLEKGSLPSNFELVSLCEEINNIFMDEMGDIVIVITETECQLIEDYREEIETWLKTQ